ncbi:LOW QUALITY PROTEIN: hypothetical protein Cgig2_024806 [Carnegiea gigantea]|uniref:Uncharacterized protein n=1 Tax=Carnegiea gigantea TaxID=171969 RepID=A0A9Q1JKJ1_9CARY|nr:LOW QUALITY PROTEIN: hypothetical protein Cgig2_024806 [Carnegiea gigantea]
MTDTITWQVSEQVKRAMEAANSTRPFPHFDYLPMDASLPTDRSGYHLPVTQREWEVSRSNWSSRPYTEQQGQYVVGRPSGRPTQGATAKSTTASTPYAIIPGRDTVPLVHPILGFGRQEVNPTGMIRLPIHFGDKFKAKNLEVDFLVVDVRTTYNVILGHPAPHKGPHQAPRRDSAHNTPLRNLVHDHRVEDHLHYLGDIGVLSIPCSHAKVETRTEDNVILREGPRTLS